MNSQQAKATSHEYRMKFSRSGLYLLLAALLIVASVPVAILGLAPGHILIAVGRVAIGVLLSVCGVFMLATVLRSRLVVDGSRIRFRIVFREEVFHLSEIEGVRTITTGPASRPVICVKGRREPIEIVQFDHDDFLQTWLQQLPNLDEPDLQSPHPL